MGRRRNKYPTKSPPGAPTVRVESTYERVIYTGQTVTNLWQGLLDDAEDRGRTHLLGGVHMKVRLGTAVPWRGIFLGLLAVLVGAIVVAAIATALAGCGPTDRCKPVTIGGAIVVGTKCDQRAQAPEGAEGDHGQ